MPDVEDVKAVIHSVAKRYELRDASPEGQDSHTVHRTFRMILTTNYDKRSGNLYVEVFVYPHPISPGFSENSREIALRTRADALLDYLSSAFESRFGYAPIVTDETRHYRKPSVTWVLVKTPGGWGKCVGAMELASKHITAFDVDDTTSGDYPSR